MLHGRQISPLISHIEYNTFSCIFHSEEDLQKVIRNSLWSFRGSHIVIQQWQADKSYEEVDFSCMEFWVQAHNLPLDRISLQNAKVIGNYVGQFQFMDKTQNTIAKQRKFLRMGVQVDITKPLKTGCFFSRHDGTATWVQFKYERLNDFC